MSFHVGQKVVYVGPDFSSNPRVLAYGVLVPVPKRVYTIRQCVSRVEGVGYLLAEIANPLRLCPVNGFCEIAIDAVYLRPVVESKTDINIFTAMLKPSKVQA